MLHIKSISRPLEIGLRLTGIWPGSPYETVIRFVWVVVMTFAQVCQYRYIIQHFDTNNLTDLIESVGTTLPYSLLCVKLIVFWTKRGTFENLLIQISNDWDNSSTDEHNMNNMTSKADLAFRCSKFIILIFITTCFMYGALFIEFMRRDVDGELKLKSRELMMKMDFPFAYYRTPTYEWVFIGQFIQLVINGYTIGTLDGLMLTLILHVGGQIEILKRALVDISIEDESGRLSKKAAKALIRKHHHIINNSDDIDSLFTYIALMQWFFNTLVICCIGFMIVITLNTDKSMRVLSKILLFYTAITMEAFIFSFGGEYLSSKSLSISYAAYSSPWYRLNSQDRRIIILLMIRSQRRLTITAGKFMDLTLEGFASILKVSASYVSVLYAMY